MYDYTAQNPMYVYNGGWGWGAQAGNAPQSGESSPYVSPMQRWRDTRQAVIGGNGGQYASNISNALGAFGGITNPGSVYGFTPVENNSVPYKYVAPEVPEVVAAAAQAAPPPRQRRRGGGGGSDAGPGGGGGAGGGGGNGDGGGTCFAKGTMFMLPDGSYKAVEDFESKDPIYGGKVIFTKTGPGAGRGWFNYHGIDVTSEHAVRERGEWKRVGDSVDATPIEDHNTWYTLITTNNRLYGDNGVMFADDAEHSYDHPVYDIPDWVARAPAQIAYLNAAEEAIDIPPVAYTQQHASPSSYGGRH